MATVEVGNRRSCEDLVVAFGSAHVRLGNVIIVVMTCLYIILFILLHQPATRGTRLLKAEVTGQVALAARSGVRNDAAIHVFSHGAN